MRLNERLNFVLPIYDADDKISAYVHSTPLSREAFEESFVLISKTFSAIHGEGLGSIAGPRVASLILWEVAKRNDDKAGTLTAAALTLMNEIRRLTNVVVSGPRGWTTVPFQDAVDAKTIDPDDLSEVENAIVFFTVYSAMHRRQTLKDLLTGAARMWGAQVSSLTPTAFAASLPTSTETVNIGEIAHRSSLPV
jgi:hypothetical protein